MAAVREAAGLLTALRIQGFTVIHQETQGQPGYRSCESCYLLKQNEQKGFVGGKKSEKKFEKLKQSSPAITSQLPRVLLSSLCRILMGEKWVFRIGRAGLKCQRLMDWVHRLRGLERQALRTRGLWLRL